MGYIDSRVVSAVLLIWSKHGMMIETTWTLHFGANLGDHDHHSRSQ